MWVKILLLFFVFSFLFRTDDAFNQDLGRHIKLGEIIIQTKQIPKTNLTSYTYPDFPFINTHWLFEVLTYFFSQNGILPILLTLKLAILLISVGLILKLSPPGDAFILVTTAFIFINLLGNRSSLRPEIFSFLFTACTLYILEEFLKKPTKLIYSLPLIQLIWINTHIYFFVGLMLQSIFFLHKRLRILILIFGLSVLASLINPNGIAGLLYPLTVNKNYGYTIVENQTIFLLESIGFRSPDFIYAKVAFGIVIFSLLIPFLRKQFLIKNILLSLSGVGLALLNVRSFPYLFFLSFPAVLQNFGVVKSNIFTKTITLIMAVILIFEGFSYLSGDYYRKTDSSNQVGLKLIENGKGAMDFVLTNKLPQPIFNNFDIGSYITYRGYPKYKTFVDGRPEAYPKEFFQDTYIPMQYDYNKFKIEEQKWGFKTIIFSHTDQTPWAKTFLQSIVLDKNWKIVYIDDFMLILIKADAMDNLAPINLSGLSPNSFQFSNHVQYLRLGYFLLITQNAPAGERFLVRGGI